MTHKWHHPSVALAAVMAICLLAGPARATSQATAAPPSSDYRLGPGDKLRIEVYKDAQLSQSAQVRPDGKITMPLVGDLVASGRTPAELRDAIATALTEYMTSPVVTVIVVETTMATAYVMGEVRQPGAVPLQRPLTVLQALALAGGLTEFANADDIRVLRHDGDATKTIDFHYKDALKGHADAVLYLESGDTVVVPD